MGLLTSNDLPDGENDISFEAGREKYIDLCINEGRTFKKGNYLAVDKHAGVVAQAAGLDELLSTIPKEYKHTFKVRHLAPLPPRHTFVASGSRRGDLVVECKVVGIFAREI